MYEPEPNELAGKAKRVLGMFITMLGSGVILESPAFWAGTLLTLAGLATFIWGLAEARPAMPIVVPRDQDGPTITVGPSGKSL